MQCCKNCNNSIYTNEGSIAFYYRCLMTGERFLSKQAESYCCIDYKNELELL